jgi:hypothetical protein
MNRSAPFLSRISVKKDPAAQFVSSRRLNAAAYRTIAGATSAKSRFIAILALLIANLIPIK